MEEVVFYLMSETARRATSKAGVRRLQNKVALQEENKARNSVLAKSFMLVRLSHAT